MMINKLKNIVQRYDEITQELSDPNVISNIQGNFGNEILFTENWIGEGGGQEEMANDVWKRLINRFNNIKGNNDLNDLTNMTEDDLKKMLINLDKPIKGEDGEIVFPACSDPSITDETECINNNRMWGLSPLDIFLYNDPEGINAAQLEALL